MERRVFMLYLIKSAIRSFTQILNIPLPLGMGYDLKVYHVVIFIVVFGLAVRFLWGLYS